MTTAPVILPTWADELRQRYLRSEASLFVLHGNVHDVVLHRKELISASDFLAESVLEKKTTVIRYNVSTGCRFTKKASGLDSSLLEELLIKREAAMVLPVLEQLLYVQKNVGVVIDYAEMIAPAGDPTFFSQQDRLAVVSLQRWSLAPQIERGDNIVVLVTESLGELNPKIVANPKVAVVHVPMPGADERRAVIKAVNPSLEDTWIERFTEVTAGLKAVQIKSILQPPPEGEEDPAARLRFLQSLIGDGDGERARKWAAITQGMSRDEVRELVGVTAPAGPGQGQGPASDADSHLSDVLARIGKRKRELIERECFGLVEFIQSAHNFSVVGGMEGVKRELTTIAADIREGRTSRVPMGLLFTGPMGTGKTFVAEAFIKESGLTGIKLKNFRSKWVGATEANLERIFDVVQAIGNVIVIIDEGDRSFGSDGDGDSGTSSRVIARLKEFMSDTKNRGRVLFILMTNRPDKLDIDIKRAGRLDRKIPFLYPQTAEEVEGVLTAQCKKHKLKTSLAFPRDREAISQRLISYSAADIEAIALLAYNYASEGAREREPEVSVDAFLRAVGDYLPSRDVEMLEYMELLAVFEASNRSLLPPKYADLSIEALQQRLAELRVRCASRR